MRTIWKFPLAMVERQPVMMPRVSRILALQNQGGIPTIWAEVDPESPAITATVTLVGTGREVPADSGDYVGTVQEQGGMFIWHFYLLRP